MTLTGIYDRFVLARAPAKLNLFLEVTGRRPDGFHEIETVMVAVSLMDSIRFQVSREGRGEVRAISSPALRRLKCEIPSGPENLAAKALERWRSSVSTSPNSCHASISILKRVPAQAGLGGGSSDAAAALRSAAAVWSDIADDVSLAKIAAQVGSDVPFFVEPGISLCRGRGELVTPLRRAAPLWFVVAQPNVGLSTRDVYERVAIPDSPWSSESICRAMERGSPREIGGLMRNRLQQAAQSLAPEIRMAADEFDRLDCCGHQMSGSGTAYFGIFANRASAVRAERRLRSRRPDWFICYCRSLARHPSIDESSTLEQEARRDYH